MIKTLRMKRSARLTLNCNQLHSAPNTRHNSKPIGYSWIKRIAHRMRTQPRHILRYAYSMLGNLFFKTNQPRNPGTQARNPGTQAPPTQAPGTRVNHTPHQRTPTISDEPHGTHPHPDSTGIVLKYYYSMCHSCIIILLSPIQKTTERTNITWINHTPHERTNTMAKIIWNKGYKPKSRNLQDVLDEMDADGDNGGPNVGPRPLNIKPLVLVKTTIEIDVTKKSDTNKQR